MQRLVILVAALALLTTCGGLKNVNLEPALVQDGDLPAGMAAGQVSDGSAGSASGATGFVARIRRSIDPGGEVGVILYDDDAALQHDFKGILPGVTVDGSPSTEFGTSAMDVGNVVVFIRCHALVHIRLSAGSDTHNAVVNYAKRLDKRLQSLVC